MNTPFDTKSGDWKIAWPGRVSKHDLVYLTPPPDPMQGIPLGNGEIGVLAWTEGTKLILAVNKSNLWDDGAGEDFRNWNWHQEEFSTTLRHACRIILDFELPVFDTFYLSDCDSRLSIADGTMTISVKGPLGSVKVTAFVGYDDGVIHCDVEHSIKDAPPVKVTLERFGSRAFAHWYQLRNRDATLGLEGTKASVVKDSLCITHKLTTGTFANALALSARPKAKATYKKEHTHAASIEMAGRKSDSFSFVACVTSPLQGGAAGVARSLLATVRENSRSAILRLHKAAWKKFWQRSLMESGDDYMDNLWHLTMYYANASQRGEYPGRFINGLWGWSRDVQNWNFYFHWNQQETYWPLNAAGHHDLVDSYLNYRFNSLPHARKDAKEHFGSDGAFISDVCERRGYNSKSELHNHTPVAQIAMEFWRQYVYTGDEEFLANKALPFMLEASRFFEPLFRKEKDGKYHAKDGTAYEGWIRLKDSLTELACARVLFGATLEALEITGTEEPRAKKWRKILEDLAPLPAITADKRAIESKNGKHTLLLGQFKGDQLKSDKVFSAGFGKKEKKYIVSRFPKDEIETPVAGTYGEIIRDIQAGVTPQAPYSADDMDHYPGIFPSSELCSVYPTGLVGIKDKDSEIYDTAVNTLKMFCPDGMGWEVHAIALARLGLGRELSELLPNFVERWQLYINGWGHYGTPSAMWPESAIRFSKGIMRDASVSDWKEQMKPENKFRGSLWEFRHMGMESMSVLSCAMNESLLQSHDGVIRIAPAIAPGQSARFTLHAVGGFVVSGEIVDGELKFAAIRSIKGGDCTVELPWKATYISRKGAKAEKLTGKQTTIALRKGETVTLTASAGGTKNLKITPVKYEKNKQAKFSKNRIASLGLERMF